MKLSVAERFNLLGILPKEGNFLTLKIVRKLREGLSFDEDEITGFGIVQEGTEVSWNPQVPQDADIPIGEKATDIIVEALRELDKSNKLSDREYSLYEKFVEGPT